MPYLRLANGRTHPGPGMAGRYRALRLTHGSLNEKLADELQRPRPDAGVVQRLKRRKLAIKDELAAIERLLVGRRAMGRGGDAGARIDD
jgi:hypothetical protein